MTVVPIAKIIESARDDGRGAGAFNVIGIEHAEAIVCGAEAAGRPVILALSENCVSYHGRLEPIGRALLAIAEAAAVPAAVHLDHASSPELVADAVRVGFGSAMYDASTMTYADNVAATAKVAAWCHDRDVWLEAELGEVGGKDGVHAPGARTEPAEAAAFVATTGVDALAVAVGSSHAMLTTDAILNLDLIARLRSAVPVPLVLHGSSGVPARMLTAAITAGLTKINIATQLNKVFTGAVRDRLTADQSLADPRPYLSAGRAAVAAEVTRLLGVLEGGVSQ